MSADANRDIEELYAVPPKEFTSARNAKAAALEAAGQAAEARAVRRLSKPAAPLWAVNQLARLVPKRVSHFIDVVEQVRGSQLRDPRAAAEAMQTQRAELAALTERAAEAMTKAGYRVSPAALGRISNTLIGAAVDRRLADDLRRGRLIAELPAPGFEVLAGAGAGLRVVRGGGAPQRQSERTAAQRAREQAERERLAKEAEVKRQDALQRAAAAERVGQEVRELERRLADARRRRRTAQREASTAADRVRRRTDQ